MNDDNGDLWRGGPWERGEGEPVSPPDAWVPVQPRPVLRVKRKRRRRWLWCIPVGLGGIVLGIVLFTVGLNALLHNLNSSPWDGRYDRPGGDGGSYAEEEDYSTEPPSIPRAETGTGAVLELSPTPGEALSYAQIYEKNLPSMVSVRCRQGYTYSSGTGIIFSEDGCLLTNAHVVAGMEEVRVTLSTNRVLDAKLVGFDPEEDLAVLKIEAEGLVPAQFGDSSALRAGEAVAAIGDSMGYRATITDGIVSALDREVDVDGVTMTLIQTSAAINFGNSGGALINQYGQVVGITTVKIISDDGSAEGLGFAIPSRRVKYVADALLDGREVRTGVFGFTVYTTPEEGGGLKLSEVDTRSDAWSKGLRAGDVITAVDGAPVHTKEDLARVKLSRGPGDVLTLTCLRNGQTITFQVALVDEDSLDK